MAVISAPVMPPMQWTPNTSSESSYLNFDFTTLTKKKQIGETIRPRITEPIVPAKPEAGVTATRPATTPEAAPSSDGLPFTICSTSTHDRPAAAVAMKVFMKATPVTPFDSKLEPALKPNQPTHSREAPIMVMVSECGGIGSRG